MRLWDLDGNVEAGKYLGHSNPVVGVAFHPTANRIAAVDNAGIVKIWNSERALEARVVALTNHYPFILLALHPDESFLAIAQHLPGLQLWPMAAAGLAYSAAPAEKVRTLVDETRRRILRLMHPNRIDLVGFSSDKLTRPLLESFFDNVNAIAFSADGAMMAGAVADGAGRNAIRSWNPRARRELTTKIKNEVETHALAFEPRGARLAMGGSDGVVRVADVTTGQNLIECHGHQSPVVSLAFSANGRYLAAVSGSPLS